MTRLLRASVFRSAAMLAILAGPNTYAGSPITLPGATFAEQARLAELSTTLDQKAASSAATILDALISDDGETLMPSGEDCLISVNTWLDTLPKGKRAELESAYRSKYDTTSSQEIEAARRDGRSTPESLYAYARRRRFSAAASAAYADAADRAADAGDLPSAAALYDLAIQGGWEAGSVQSARIDSIRKVAQGDLFPLPVEGFSRIIRPFSGPLPFDATWYDASVTGSRHLPVAGDDRMFISGSNAIAAFRESGQVIWFSTLDGVKGAVDPSARATWTPAILNDVYGRAHVVVARQVFPEPRVGSGKFILRAVRGTDGKQIWSTDAQPLFKDTTFAGTPVISGRYTFCLGLAETPERATLSLIALDTLDGHLRWQTTLGFSSVPAKGEPEPWQSLYESSEPLAVNDAVYVSPGCGLIACLARFDGRLRWIRSYAASDAPPLRFRGTPALCGDVLVSSPQDSGETFAVDAKTGALKWTRRFDTAALIGSHDSLAIFAGPKNITAIKASDGTIAWAWQPPASTPITGPGTLQGDQVLIPTSAPIFSLSAADGSVISREARGVPFLRRALNADPTKDALEKLGARKAIGIAEKQPQ